MQVAQRVAEHHVAAQPHLHVPGVAPIGDCRIQRCCRGSHLPAQRREQARHTLWVTTLWVTVRGQREDVVRRAGIAGDNEPVMVSPLSCAVSRWPRVLAASVLATSACSGGASSDGAGTSPPPGELVTVTERDFAIELARTSFAPGDYTFRVTNDGSLPHDLAISGPELPEQVTERLAPGETGQVTVSLREGRYTLWCTVGDHRGRGMETQVEVAG